MRILDVEDITASYPQTLRHWRENWLAAAGQAERLGADRRFRRLFELYFAWSEGGLKERRRPPRSELGEREPPARSQHVIAALHGAHDLGSPLLRARVAPGVGVHV